MSTLRNGNVAMSILRNGNVATSILALEGPHSRDMYSSVSEVEHLDVTCLINAHQ